MLLLQWNMKFYHATVSTIMTARLSKSECFVEANGEDSREGQSHFKINQN